MYDNKDSIKWMLTADRLFIFKSLYRHLVVTESGFPQKFMWNIKIPPKNQSFYFVHHG